MLILLTTSKIKIKKRNTNAPILLTTSKMKIKKRNTNAPILLTLVGPCAAAAAAWCTQWTSLQGLILEVYLYPLAMACVAAAASLKNQYIYRG